jgi:uncharacterized repeat protein (TIGR01451 family)
MKHFFKPRVSGLLLTLLLFAGGTQTALALTASGVTISNQATVNYVVDLLPQTAILSDDLVTGAGPTTFLVDNKVDLTVTNLDGGTITVTPGSSDRVLTFSVTNTGNTTQGYSLSVVNGATAITMGAPEIWLDTDLDGVYTLAGDTQYTPGNNAGDLDPNTLTPLVDAVMTVFIVADTPLTAVDATVDNYSLLATTLDETTTDVTAADGDGDDPTLVEVVFADVAGTAAGDAANDGEHSDTGSYTVGSAALTITKTAVALDAFGTDYAIPGATVTYTIVITNNGTADADSVVITDDISAFTPADVAWVVDSITLGGATQTDLADVDSSTFAGNLVTVNVGTLALGGGTTTITFQVTIN